MTNRTQKKETQGSKTPNEDKVEVILQTLDPLKEELNAILVDDNGRFIRARHDIGKAVIRHKQCIELAQRRGGIYQVDVLAELEESLGMPEKSIQTCRRFAELYDDAAVEELQNLPIRITWSHIRELVTIPTESQRKHFLRRIAKENLTASELAREKKKELGNQREGSGRKIALPKTLKKGVARLSTELEKLQKVEEVLFGDEFNVVFAIMHESPGELDQQLLDELEAAIQRMDDLSNRFRENLPQLLEARDRIRGEIAANQEHDAMIAAGMSDEEIHAVLMAKTKSKSPSV